MTTLYSGALGSSFATLVGHYPWFVTYDFIKARIPEVDGSSSWRAPFAAFLRVGDHHMRRERAVGAGRAAVEAACPRDEGALSLR